MLENLYFLKSFGGALFTFIGGFILAYMGKYLPSANKQKSDDFRMLIETYQKQHENILQEVKIGKENEKECLEKYSALEAQLLKLQSNMFLMRASSPNIPIPMWVKDINGTMLALNDEYERVFLMPLGKRREDSIGKTDDDIWGEELAKRFKKSDAKVLDDEELIVGLDPIKVGDEGNYRLWNIVKYPNKIGDLVVTIGGIAFPEPKNRYFKDSENI